MGLASVVWLGEGAKRHGPPFVVAALSDVGMVVGGTTSVCKLAVVARKGTG